MVFWLSLFSREQVINSDKTDTNAVTLGFPYSLCLLTAAVLYYYLYKRTAEHMGDPRLYEDSMWLRDQFARARQWQRDSVERNNKGSLWKLPSDKTGHAHQWLISEWFP